MANAPARICQASEVVLWKSEAKAAPIVSRAVQASLMRRIQATPRDKSCSALGMPAAGASNSVKE